MDERNSINRVQITIDLPVEVADLLAVHDEAMIMAMVAVAKKCRLNPSEQKRTAGKEKRKENVAVNLAQLIKLGRVGYRYQRQNPGSNSVGSLAVELGVSGQRLKFFIAHFRKKINAKIKFRRNREIIRYAEMDLTNEEIASRIGIHKNTVSKVVDVERKRMAQSSQHKPGGDE